MSDEERHHCITIWPWYTLFLFVAVYMVGVTIGLVIPGALNLPPAVGIVSIHTIALATFVASIYYYPRSRQWAFVLLILPAIIVFSTISQTKCTMSTEEVIASSLFPLIVMLGLSFYFDCKEASSKSDVE